MEEHVSITKRLLDKIKFTDEYREVTNFAASHHEKLNGKGYPLGIMGDELSLPTRILAIMDVFEALTAKDRPYKPPMPMKKALAIIEDMTSKGEFDDELVELLKVFKAEEE